MVKVFPKSYNKLTSVEISFLDSLYKIENVSLEIGLDLITEQIIKDNLYRMNREELASELNISRTKLYRLMDKYKVKYRKMGNK